MKRGLLPLLLLANLQVIFANKFRCIENDLTPASMECNKYFTCMHGKKVLQECPDDLHFNPILKKCDSPSKAGCDVDPSEEENDYFNLELTKYKNKEENSKAKEIGKSLLDKCRANSPGETVFSHNKDCEKYYVCEEGTLVEMSCPTGLYFNPILNVCDYPENANCRNTKEMPVPSKKSASSEDSNSSEISDSTEGNGSNISEDSSTSDENTTNKPNGKCRGNNPGEVEFAPHSDCGKYYVCEHNQLIEMSCPDGLHFNPTLNICDYPEDANCQGSIPSTEIQSSSESTVSTELTSENSTEEGSNATNGPNLKCKTNNPGEVEFTPHENCEKYYVCIEDNLIEMSCSEGLHFNKELNICDEPENAKCDSSGSTVPPNPTQLPTEVSTEETPITEPTNAPTEEPSKGPTELTTTESSNNNTSEVPENSQSTTENEIVTNPSGKCRANNPGEVEFAPHLDCDKYYVCEGDRLIEMSCPPGLHFNPVLNVCDYPEDANCQGSPSSTELPSSSESSVSTERPSENSTDGESNTTERPNITCKNNNPGEVEFTPHENCEKYYVCIDDNLIVMSCPEGLHFNKELNICDEPENANCEASASTEPPKPTQLPTEEQTEETTKAPITEPTNTPTKVPSNAPTEETTTELSNTNTSSSSTEPPSSSESSVSTDGSTENSTEGQSNTTERPNMNCKTNNPGEVEFTPHENCEKYYVCIEDNLIEMSCPEGLHFNKELNICDEPENAKCDSSGSTVPPNPTQLPTEVSTEETPITEPTNAPTEEPSKGPTELTTTESSNNNTSEVPENSQSTTDNEIVTNPSGKCRANNPGEVEFLPHLDCDKYYVCEGDRLIEMSCPPGLHFNPVLNVCDYPEDANCQGSPSSTELPSSSESSVSTETPSENSTEGESNTTERPNIKCKNNNPGEVEFTPHENCEKYYVCIDDNLIVMSCPEGLHFNKELNICDEPENANCEASASTEPPKPTQLPTEEQTEETTKAPITEPTNTPTKVPSNAPTEETTTELSNTNTSSSSTEPPSSSESSVSTDGSTENSTEGQSNTTERPNMNCKTNNPGEVEFTPHENCEKYYVCIEDNLIEMSCPEGLHFNKELNICDEPENAKCDSSGSTVPPNPTQLPTEVSTEETPITEPTNAPTEEPSKGPTELTTTESSNNNTSEVPENSQSTTENEIVTNPSGKCRANNPGEVEFAPHLDCDKYYVCEGDRLIEMSCPPGLHFNPVLNVCDYPEDANCQGSPSSTELPSSSESSVSTETPSENSTEGESNITERPNIKCKNNNPGEVEFTPHENCEKYYVCIDDNLIEMSCPEGLHFNKELNICDEPENANCEASASTEPPKPTQLPTEEQTEETTKAPITEPTNAPTEEPSNAPSEENTTESSNTNISSSSTKPPSSSDSSVSTDGSTEISTEGQSNTTERPNMKCKTNNPGEVEFTPHENCEKYYVCIENNLIEMSCPEGLHFNKELNVCDEPENANCDTSGSTVPPNPTQLPTEVPTEETTTQITEPTNAPTEEPSKGPTELTTTASSNNNTSEVPENSQSTTENEIVTNPSGKCRANNPGEVEFAPHLDCDKYYVCEGNRLIEMSCPPGLHFNPVLNVCDYPEDANCQGSPSSTELPSSSESSVSTETPSENSTEGESNTTERPNIKCKNNNPGEVEFTPHENCEKYYVCIDDNLIEMSCPEGLHFNKELNICDEPENANCEASASTESPKPTQLPTEEQTEEPTKAPITEPTNAPTEEPSNAPSEENTTESLNTNTSSSSTKPPSSSDSSVSTDGSTEISTEGQSNTTERPNMKCKTNNPGEVEFTPHENCEKYYVCIDNNLIEMSCPEGLHFNKELNICDEPANADCETSASTELPAPTQLPTEEPTEETTKAPITEPTNAPTEEPSKTPTELTSTELSNTDTSSSSTELPSSSESSVSSDGSTENSTEGQSNTTEWPNMKCKTNNPGEIEFTPHENCEKYYVCIENNLIEMSCPEGLHFNRELNVCDEPENANCDTSGSTVTPNPTQLPTQVPTEETTKAPITKPTNAPTKEPSKAPTPTQLPTEEQTEETTKAPVTEPTNVPTEEPSKAPTELTTTESANNSSEAPGNSQSTTENEIVPNPSGKCRANNPGEVEFAPHPICEKYFICDNDRLIEMNCPEGLHFNPQLNVCDYPANAKCQESQNNSTQAPSTGNGSETTESEVTNKPQSGKCRANNPGEVEFASHSDCSKYYVCDHGVMIEMNCPAGLHFNSVLNVCDYIEDAKCLNTFP